MANIDIIKELRIDPWPYNILKYTSKIVKEKLGEDYGMTLEAVQELLDSLKKQERSVLYLRTVDGMSYVKAAEELHVSHTRIEQVQKDVLHKLQNEKWLKNFAYISPESIKELKDSLFNAYHKLNLCITYGTFPFWMSKYVDGIKLSPIIEDLDLSVRSFNCLKRSGYETLDDILNATEGDLLKIRNLGRRSLDEIVNKIHELGMQMSWEIKEVVSNG